MASAFDFEGGSEYGDFYGLGADLAEDEAPSAEKTPAFNDLWNSKYKGKKDWEGKPYSKSDKAKAKKAFNAGWREQRSGALSGGGGGGGGGWLLPMLISAVAVWWIFREKPQST